MIISSNLANSYLNSALHYQDHLAIILSLIMVLLLGSCLLVLRTAPPPLPREESRGLSQTSAPYPSLSAPQQGPCLLELNENVCQGNFAGVFRLL